MFAAMKYRSGFLSLLDQRKLPTQEIWLDCRKLEEVAEAIETMAVRGAPAIGCAAAYGILLHARNSVCLHWKDYKENFKAACDRLAATRPTAVNLFYVIEKAIAMGNSFSGELPLEIVRKELEHLATEIFEQDIQTCRQIGQHGLALASGNRPLRILTHCNTGSLATAGYGTAIGIIRACHESGILQQVYVDETRPWLQGARLTAFELMKEGIENTLIVEGAAAYLMALGMIDWVVVGADRIAANGDTANKIGTYSLAVLARYHGIKFYVAAPLSSFDSQVESGGDIPIEERPGEEITHINGKNIAPKGCKGLNFAFDITPAHLIDGIITEVGTLVAPYQQAIVRAMN
ncbi:MAG: S-methyl-5-thioribose-1-phosphate isomerase [Oligoflexales bacterium]